MIHTSQGLVRLCAWYRPPCSGEVDTITSFKEELLQHSAGTIGTLVVGDLNVHNPSWLKFSSRNSVEGRALQHASAESGLVQIVKSPTRGEHLLDLVLTDLVGVVTTILGAISDHSAVLAVVKLHIPETHLIQRKLWHFQSADWERLSDMLCEIKPDWNTVDAAVETMSGEILSCASACIRKEIKAVKKSSHPWLTHKAIEAVAEKHKHQGSTSELEATKCCSKTFRLEYIAFAEREKKALSELKRGSKVWWTK